MEASDLCLIIDNTQSFLNDWLHRARRWHKGTMTATGAEHFFRQLMVSGVVTSRPSFRAEVINLLAERIDWQEIADHYNTKVKEGASVPDKS